LSRLGVGRQPHFGEYFFGWWDGQIIAIKDYHFRGVDYQGDPEMVLPNGEGWRDDLDKNDWKKQLFKLFRIFDAFAFLKYMIFFCV